MAPHLQDMPPEGGYQRIIYHRIPAKTYFSGYTMILGYLGMTAAGLYLFNLNRKKINRLNVEARSARIAIEPLLAAERDREYLKQLRRNRDEEGKLMANVEGWKVGMYDGQPLFKTLPPDTLISPTFEEYYAQAKFEDARSYAETKFWV